VTGTPATPGAAVSSAPTGSADTPTVATPNVADVDVSSALTRSATAGTPNVAGVDVSRAPADAADPTPATPGATVSSAPIKRATVDTPAAPRVARVSAFSAWPLEVDTATIGGADVLPLAVTAVLVIAATRGVAV
jgi:hypothetical protein